MRAMCLFAGCLVERVVYQAKMKKENKDGKTKTRKKKSDDALEINKPKTLNL